jgi:tRNA pseudouridine55 synthase
MSARVTGPSGVLAIDKPRGPTSHDVVARLRRALGTRRVGHGGTLDPMASGVLVVLVGEATKLAPYVTGHDKRYVARVSLGAATDTLDAEGRVTERGEVPGDVRAAIAAVAGGAGASGPLLEALLAEKARATQIPPVYSAIQIGGRRSYDLARAGEVVELAPRDVAVREVRVTDARAEGDDVWLDLELAVSKGYYVRSLARDLGARLGAHAHLAALRRTASGPFTEARAIAADASREALLAAAIPLAVAARDALPWGELTEEGAPRARAGKRLAASDFRAPPGPGPAAWLDATGALVAIGEADGDAFVVRRGFSDPG